MARTASLALASLAVVVVAIIFLDRLYPPPLHLVKTGVVVTDYQGRWLHGFPVRVSEGDIRWRLAADLKNIDEGFVDHLLMIEDKRFLSHPGVDGLAVIRAFGSFVSSGEIVSGASTITMQTARLLEPRPRNIGSKLIEMVRALQIEARLSKVEILELYLTLAPYGGNIEGVRAASLSYFANEPQHLTDAQIALLIALPQSPEARRPDRRPLVAKAARDVILDRLGKAAVLSPARAAEAKEVGVPTSRMPFKRLAWHAAQATSKQLPRGGEVAMSLDAEMQFAAQMLARQVALASVDQANVAILIVENNTGAVRASVGSAGVDIAGGWIDMTKASRSPGSTLKPFIYGLAFDDGAATAETLIYDAAYSFDGYKPENFSRGFHGDVSVTQALQHSLNVPAVLALDRIGPDRFVASLAAAGLSTRLPKKATRKASLAVALGGVGLSPRDLAMLYAGIATDGTVRPLVWYADTPEKRPGYKLISAASATRLGEIMRDAPAPAGRVPSALSRTAPRVAFKTGTSYGYRDAWSAGYTDKYTSIVWVGHANGTPRPGATGRQAALPLLFDVFDMLDNSDRGLKWQAPEEFKSGQTLARFDQARDEQPPEIVFPEDGVELFLAQQEGWQQFTLAARGGAGAYRWYVDGRPLAANQKGRVLWQPPGAGHYKITIVDQRGLSASSFITVRHASQG